MKSSLFAAILFILVSAVSFAQKPGTSLRSLEHELLSNNLQLQALEANVKAQKATANSIYGNFIPTLSINGGYGDENTLTDIEQGYLGYISSTWSLYKGGEDLSLKKIAEQQFRMAEIDKEQTTRSLRKSLQQIYYNILSTKKTISLLEEKARLLNQQRQMAQKKINAGLTSSVDGLEIDLEENSLVAEGENLKTELIQLSTDLESLLNAKIGESQIAENENFDTDTSPVNLETALSGNPSIQKQRLQDEISINRTSQSRSEFLPHVNIEASYGRLTPQYGDPFKGTESKLFVLMSWNLFSGLSSYYKNQASSLESKSQELETKNVYLEVRRDLENLLTSRNNILKLKAHQQQRLLFASRYYDMTLSEYKRGIKNSADLETATSSLFESKRKLIELDRDLSVTNARIYELI